MVICKYVPLNMLLAWAGDCDGTHMLKKVVRHRELNVKDPVFFFWVIQLNLNNVVKYRISIFDHHNSFIHTNSTTTPVCMHLLSENCCLKLSYSPTDTGSLKLIPVLSKNNNNARWCFFLFSKSLFPKVQYNFGVCVLYYPILVKLLTEYISGVHW